jgi:4-amino-4-deoxy-L-arabinose transferase-like glycosyltransferase
MVALLTAAMAFISLGSLPIRIWDESRLAVSAYEMYKSGFSLITTFEGRPDLWNTKPPLLIWLQAGLMHLIGPSEEAVRIPSALAVWVTALALIFYTRKITNTWWPGIFAAFILVSTEGFMNFHAGRSGDYDAMLSMWTTLSAFTFFLACQERFSRPKRVYLFFLFLALGTLTKSIAALMFAPAFLIFLFLTRTTLVFIKQRSVYVGIGLYAILVGGFYFGREAMESGYLEAVWVNDLFGRYATPLDDHRGSFSFYFEKFIDYQFTDFYLPALAGLIAAGFRKSDNLRLLLIYSGILFFTYMAVISSAETKLEWYATPLFPFASLAAGGFFYMILEAAGNFRFLKKQYPMTVSAVGLTLLLVIMGKPYLSAIQRYYKEKDEGGVAEFYRFAKYLKDGREESSIPDGYTVVHSEYAAHEYFYVELMKDEGKDIRWKHVNQVNPGERIIAGSHKEFDPINRLYNLDVLWEDNGVKGLLIKEKKEP